MDLRSPLRPALVAVALIAAVGCEGSQRITGVGGGTDPLTGRYPGFDIGSYPGDAALAAWRFPTSPYYWVGYYLAAPCHRDESWMGTRARVSTQGWGTALLYVGQQDWSNIPNEAPLGAARLAPHPELSASLAVTCSASLLTASQGVTEAADAVAKASAEGFPVGSTIFLDVEFVTTVTTPLRDYVTAWTAAVLADGRYRAGIYCAKSNAATLYESVLARYAAAARGDAPPFWIASSTGFSLDRVPTAVGVSFATIWQGRFDVTETWGGVSRSIDVDVAFSPSPSAP